MCPPTPPPRPAAAAPLLPRQCVFHADPRPPDIHRVMSGMARRRRIVASMDGGAADSSSTSPSRRVCKHSARNLGASLKMRSGLCSRERACVCVVRATPWHPVRPHGHNNIIGARFTSNNNVTLNLHHRGFFFFFFLLPSAPPTHTYTQACFMTTHLNEKNYRFFFKVSVFQATCFSPRRSSICWFYF